MCVHLCILTSSRILQYDSVDKFVFIRWGCHKACPKEMHLNGRLFTWNNERNHPTIERIERAFISKEWDESYPNHDLCSLPSMCSDHAPLLLCTNNMFKHHKRFHFMAYKPKFLGYLDMVQRVWHCPLREADMCRKMDWLLHKITHVLKSWSERCISNIIV
jgi:hypothetical protein